MCALESGVICSGSRDASVRVWVPAEGNTYKQEKALYGHEHWIAALLALPRSDLHPRGSIISGMSLASFITLYSSHAAKNSWS